MAAETDFSLVYDGPSLADGRIPVRDLAPALLSLGDVFAEAGAALYPDRPAVALDIRATNEGSFDVELILTGPSTAWDQLVRVFGSDDATALVNLKEIVIGGGVGLFWLIKRMRGRTIQVEEAAPKEGHVRLTLDDETSVEIPAEVATLYRRTEIRKSARGVVEPLSRGGIDRVEFRSETEVTLELREQDLPAFAEPELEEAVLTDHTFDLAVTITSVVFTEGNKWRFSDGERTFYASIEDEVFLDRVDKGIEAFRKGDILRCRMQLSQSQRGTDLHSEYRVLEVLEHMPRGVQMRLEGAQSQRPPELPPGSDQDEGAESA